MNCGRILNLATVLNQEEFIAEGFVKMQQNHRIATPFNEKQFDVSNLNGGTYFFKLSLDGNATENLKLLIVK